jgi:hypothetical protein
MFINFHERYSSAENAYSKPGIFAISCIKTDLALFGESENAYEALKDIWYELQYRTLENEKLLEDFKEYGDFSFRFEILDCSDEMKNPKVRKETLNEYKKDWGLDSLYDDIERS